jgi:hypothetical protein
MRSRHIDDAERAARRPLDEGPEDVARIMPYVRCDIIIDQP